MTTLARITALLLTLLLSCGVASAAFDQRHTAWDALVRKHVVPIDNGLATQVHYAAFKRERVQLKGYLDALSAVTQAEFNGWSKPDQLAFLINAYNAFTVELILTRYPELESIQDFGKFFNNPWKKKFFTLFGKPATLDEIEHGLIRAEGVYDDPRIHMAVNCASVGCPALRNEAYVGARLDEQLEDAVKRFLSDHSRNRVSRGTLEVSKIFDWYGKDFARGFRGARSLEVFFAAYAAQLTDKPEDLQRVREGKARIKFLDYDWALNDRRPAQ